MILTLKRTLSIIVAFWITTAVGAADRKPVVPDAGEIEKILDSQSGQWLGTELLKNRETGQWRVGEPISLIIRRIDALSDHHSYGGDFEFTRHFRSPQWVFSFVGENGDEVVAAREDITELDPVDANGHWQYVTEFLSSPLEGPVMERKEIILYSYGTFHKRYFDRPVGSSVAYSLYGEFIARRVGDAKEVSR